ncbi:MAG TPA: sugar ABC transporter substrate-binding protein [Gammaproteobacteria bacterium]|nr:sugar ABC transporter substrate-binding protein [Gammaproteobacteria bacterium]
MITGCETLGPVSSSSASGGQKIFVDESAASVYKNAQEYRIGVDDVVSVNVWKNPDLSVEVPVRPDGNISVPLIGDVEVGGRTPTEVAASIKQDLSQYLRDPQVTVILAELKSHEFLSRVRITGAVETPKSIPYRQGMTVLDAVLEAGGVTKFASADATKLYRRAGGKSQVIPVKLNRILKKGDLKTNHDILPGDVITVPERAF